MTDPRYGLRFFRRLILVLALVVLMVPVAPEAWAQDTLKQVRDRGHLVCGVSKGLTGFSFRGSDDRWQGFDVDFCRAVAGAIFSDANRVKFVPLSAKKRFEALTTGKIDLLSRNTTWTMSRDVDLALEHVGITYFDGQSFMVRSNRSLHSALQLADTKICVVSGTTSETNVMPFFAQHKISVELVRFANRKEALKAYSEDKCEVFTGDRSALASQRLDLAKPDDHMLLPEMVSKEPLGPVVRQDDPRWSDLVRWVLFLLINAEEAGWSSAKAKATDGAGAKAPIAVPETVTKTLTLPVTWPQDVIGAVGNYGEIFARNIGKNSPLKLKRGTNALWTRGGLLYAPPMR